MPGFHHVQLETLLEASTVVEKIANDGQEDLSETMKNGKDETDEVRKSIDGVLDQYLADYKLKQDTKAPQVNLEEKKEKRGCSSFEEESIENIFEEESIENIFEEESIENIQKFLDEWTPGPDLQLQS